MRAGSPDYDSTFILARFSAQGAVSGADRAAGLDQPIGSDSVKPSQCSSTSQVNGMPVTGKTPLSYKRTADTPNLGYLDSTVDMRRGMGIEGLAQLAKFVQQGGTLIVEGSTATIFPDYGLTSGVTVEHPEQLFVHGSILRGKIVDKKSPIAYGLMAPICPSTSIRIRC
jgi:hypothetical protein